MEAKASTQSVWKTLKAGILGRKAVTTVQSAPNSPAADPTDVDEVWFVGCHTDVGGGSVTDDTVYSLGDVSLGWMLKEIMTSQCGILFNEERLIKQGYRVSAFTEQPPSTNPPEDKNALQPIHDALHTAGVQLLWWILEVVPTKYVYQDTDGVWHTTWKCVSISPLENVALLLTIFRPNLGKGRVITLTKPNFHTSVSERERDKALGYKPRATIVKNGQPVFVS